MFDSCERLKTSGTSRISVSGSGVRYNYSGTGEDGRRRKLPQTAV